MELRQGLLIAVEGVDKSGKETQVDELAKQFIMDGQEVITIDFPSDDSVTGQAIRAILEGYHPLDRRENAVELQALFAINRYEQQTRIETALMQGKVVICDRYIASGLVYGMNAGVDSQWLYDIHHSLVQPDITVLLDIDRDTYLTRCGNYDELDSFEQDTAFIDSAMKLYAQLAEQNEWVMLDGKLPVEELAWQVYHNIKLRIADMEVLDV